MILSNGFKFVEVWVVLPVLQKHRDSDRDSGSDNVSRKDSGGGNGGKKKRHYKQRGRPKKYGEEIYVRRAGRGPAMVIRLHPASTRLFSWVDGLLDQFGCVYNDHSSIN